MQTLKMLHLLLVTVNFVLIKSEWVRIPQIFNDQSKDYTSNLKSSEFLNRLPQQFEEDSWDYSNASVLSKRHDFVDSLTVIPKIEESSESIEEVEEAEQEVNNTTTKPELKRKFRIIQIPNDNFPNFGFFNLMDFIKNIQESFVMKASSGLKAKIDMLNDFKNKMLMNIENRIKELWPKKLARNKRGLMGNGEGQHMDFPSAEGALITISFLTFAVFLIKLVLQVINTIKSKHYNYNGFDTTTGSGSVKIIKKQRNARKLSYSESDIRSMANILGTLETFKTV